MKRVASACLGVVMRSRVSLAALGVALPLVTSLWAECSFAQGPCTPVLGVKPDTLDFGEVPLNHAATLGFIVFDDEPGPSCAIEIFDISLESGGNAFQLENLPSFPVQLDKLLLVNSRPICAQPPWAPHWQCLDWVDKR
jgi:hypothetical protein